MASKLESNWFYKKIRRYHLFFAMECTIALLLSYYCAYWLSLLTHFPSPQIGGLWGAISSAIVISPMRDVALKAGWSRFVGSLIGVIIPMIFIYIFGYGIFAFAFSIFFALIVCFLLPWSDSYHGALITIAVVVIVGHVLESTTSVWFNACSRLMESIIGIVISLLVVLILYPLRRSLHLTTESVST